MMIEDANKKIQNLDHAINDVQNCEKKLFELKDWIAYMDKYLLTFQNLIIRIPKWNSTIIENETKK